MCSSDLEVDRARELARTMVGLGESNGVRTVALLFGPRVDRGVAVIAIPAPGRAGPVVHEADAGEVEVAVDVLFIDGVGRGRAAAAVRIEAIASLRRRRTHGWIAVQAIVAAGQSSAVVHEAAALDVEEETAKKKRRKDKKRCALC